MCWFDKWLPPQRCRGKATLCFKKLSRESVKILLFSPFELPIPAHLITVGSRFVCVLEVSSEIQTRDLFITTTRKVHITICGNGKMAVEEAGH
jgi:hypothetical protein